MFLCLLHSFENDSLTAIQSQFKSDVFISKPQIVEDLQGLADSVEIKKYVDTVSDQIKHLKTAVEHTIELNKNKVRGDVTEGKTISLIIFYGFLIIHYFIFQPINIIAKKLKNCKNKLLNLRVCCPQNVSKLPLYVQCSNPINKLQKLHSPISNRNMKMRRWS